MKKTQTAGREAPPVGRWDGGGDRASRSVRRDTPHLDEEGGYSHPAGGRPMRARIVFSALLCALLAAPVIAQVGGFPDVPEDHPRAEAIRWAAEEELFLGFPDGNLRPDVDLTRTQFVRVSERLYDSADAWSRADWAQVMYAGVPSLTGPPVTTTAAAPVTTADVSLRCGWPLGDAEAVLPLPDTGPPREIRFPITPCAPPVTYRIAFGDQTLNLPYTTDEATYTPALAWPGDARSDFSAVTVTEYRPGGPPDGKRVGSANIPWRAIRDRAPSAPTSTTASLPATAATTSTTTTTTRPPTVTIPPPEPVAEVPYGERDVVVHWFHHPGSENWFHEKKGDRPVIGLYVADPDGPIPLEIGPGKMRSADFTPRVRAFTLGGVLSVGHNATPHTRRMYFSGHPGSAFVPFAYTVAADTHEVIVDIRYTINDDDERVEQHPFRSISFVQVEPPSAECLRDWQTAPSVWGWDASAVLGNAECHPAEWARWWGVRATHRAEDSQ